MDPGLSAAWTCSSPICWVSLFPLASHLLASFATAHSSCLPLQAVVSAQPWSIAVLAVQKSCMESTCVLRASLLIVGQFVAPSNTIIKVYSYSAIPAKLPLIATNYNSILHVMLHYSMQHYNSHKMSTL